MDNENLQRLLAEKEQLNHEANRRNQEVSNHDQEINESDKVDRAETYRVVKLQSSAREILDDLDAEFERHTALNSADWSILLLATALQLARIHLLPRLKRYIEDSQRLKHDDPLIKQWEKEQSKDYFDDKKDKWGSVKSRYKKYRGWQEIATTIKVPYDCSDNCNAFGFNMHGGDHRFKSLGHDPILGWIFGVCNIMTDTITVVPESRSIAVGAKHPETSRIFLPALRCFKVNMKEWRWTFPMETSEMFARAKESYDEDPHRLLAAIFMQGVHLASDKYTKAGLPIPFLSTIAPDKAYEIYKQFDFLDLEQEVEVAGRASKAAAISMLINRIIAGVHRFFYNPHVDPDANVYAAKTHKILLYSNLIATSSDIVGTAIAGYMGDMEAVDNFDFGGFIVTIFRILTDVDMISRLKREFITRKWDDMLLYNNELSHHGNE